MTGAPGLRPPDLLLTPRLRLRPPVLDDATRIFDAYAQDAEVTRYLLWAPHAHVEETREFLRRCRDVREAGTAFTWALTWREGPEAGRLLGMVELRADGHRPDLGYVLARPYWGAGLMTEAVRAVVEWALAQPVVHRVWAVCDRENVASARVLEKAGLAREGLLRRWLVHPGMGATPRDCWCYAVVKENG